VTAETPKSSEHLRTRDADAEPASTRRISRVDHDLLNFAISWLPYGGGPDDEILINFGLTRQRYVQRIRELVERHRNQIHPGTAERLIGMGVEVADEAPLCTSPSDRPSGG
jgi:hypothetical protein